MILFLWRKSVICGILPHPPAPVPPRSPASRGMYPEASGKGSAIAGIAIRTETLATHEFTRDCYIGTTEMAYKIEPNPQMTSFHHSGRDFDYGFTMDSETI